MNKEIINYGVYSKSLLNKKISLCITEIGGNIFQILEMKVKEMTENKCISEGFVKPDSIKITSHSAGVINSQDITFSVTFECLICHPVEGQKIECTTKTITKAGIHAQVIDKDNTVPLHIFVAKDHHIMDNYFTSIKEEMKILVKVIGIRFELNDPNICVISKLIKPETDEKTGGGKKKKIKIIEKN